MAEAIDTGDLVAWVREFGRLIADNRDHLNELDSANGDADHGSNLERGMTAIVERVTNEPHEGPAAFLKQVGVTLMSEVGGSSGVLYGTIFLRMSGAAGKETQSMDDATLGHALRAAAEGVVERGRVQAGDKTLYDALAPAVDAFEVRMNAGESRSRALAAAVRAAEAGRDATTAMRARKGKSSYAGDKSAGSQDPGATSVALLITAAASVLGN